MKRVKKFVSDEQALATILKMERCHMKDAKEKLNGVNTLCGDPLLINSKQMSLTKHGLVWAHCKQNLFMNSHI